MTLDALSILSRLIVAARHAEYPEGDTPVVGEAEELLRELQDRSAQALRSVTLLQRLEAWANEHDADVSIGSVVRGEHERPPKREWLVMMNFGREAPDSPMYAGSALGADESLEKAIEQALGEVKA